MLIEAFIVTKIQHCQHRKLNVNIIILILFLVCTRTILCYQAHPLASSDHIRCFFSHSGLVLNVRQLGNDRKFSIEMRSYEEAYLARESCFIETNKKSFGLFGKVNYSEPHRSLPGIFSPDTGIKVVNLLDFKRNKDLFTNFEKSSFARTANGKVQGGSRYESNDSIGHWQKGVVRSNPTPNIPDSAKKVKTSTEEVHVGREFSMAEYQSRKEKSSNS